MTQRPAGALTRTGWGPSPFPFAGTVDKVAPYPHTGYMSNHTTTEERTMNATETRPRCYQEFCCNTATVNVVVVDRSYDHSQPARPWGYCTQHAPNEADVIARVTGSVSATVTTERRDPITGELVTLSVVTSTPRT